MMKTPSRSLGNNKNLVSLAENISVAVFESLCFLIIARSYTKDIFAEWVFYSSLVLLMEQVQMGLIWTALIKYVSETASTIKNRALTGSGWILGLAVSVIIFVLCYAALLISHAAADVRRFDVFLRLYPFFFLFSLPLKAAIAGLRARRRYARIVVLRALSYSFFIMFAIVNFFMHFSIEILIIAHIVSFSLAGVISIITGDSGIKHIPHAGFSHIKQLVNFGKYSLGTALGSNLLKNFDLFLIKLLMTNIQVSLYSVPMRILEILNIPLTSVSNVIFPEMSAADKKNKKREAAGIFYKYTGIVTLGFIPLLVAMFLGADLLVYLVGGAQYAGTSSTQVLYVFLSMGVILPFDRFTGTLLDSINKPKYTFLKVSLMLTVNIAGDLIAILAFRSTLLVAAATIANMLIGNIFVYFHLKKTYAVRLIDLFKTTFVFIKQIIQKKSTSIKKADQA